MATVATSPHHASALVPAHDVPHAPKLPFGFDDALLAVDAAVKLLGRRQMPGVADSANDSCLATLDDVARARGAVDCDVDGGSLRLERTVVVAPPVNHELRPALEVGIGISSGDGSPDATGSSSSYSISNIPGVTSTSAFFSFCVRPSFFGVWSPFTRGTFGASATIGFGPGHRLTSAMSRRSSAVPVAAPERAALKADELVRRCIA